MKTKYNLILDCIPEPDKKNKCKDIIGKTDEILI